MANETMITVQGWIGNDPVLREAGGVAVLNFRVGCTPRHFDRASGEWVDRDTQWYSVSAWRRLAAHGARSLRCGDPVVIHGRVNHRTYQTQSGSEGVSVDIEALSMGHDLSHGCSSFSKTAPSVTVEQPKAESAQESEQAREVGAA